MAFNIFRPLNSQERLEMSEVSARRQKSILNSFCSTLADISIKYKKSYRPYDSYGARQDFESKMKNKLDEIQKTLDPEKINTNIEFGDLDKYADPERFEYVKRTEVMSARLVMGMKQEIKIGYRFHFKGKERGNRISMFVPEEDLEKVQNWINKTYNINIKEEETRFLRVDEIPEKKLDRRLSVPDIDEELNDDKE